MIARAARRQRGFTLLEVLVAIAVFAIFSTVSYAALSRMIDNRELLNQERDRWRAIALAFTQMEEDLAHARPRPIRYVDATIRPAFIGRRIDTRAEAEPSIEFTRGGMFVSEAAASDMRRMAYTIKDGKLVRLVWPQLDLPPTSEPQEITLIRDVDNAAVRFYSPDGGWVEVWGDGTGDPYAMPTAVELAFDLKGAGRITRVFAVQR